MGTSGFARAVLSMHMVEKSAQQLHSQDCLISRNQVRDSQVAEGKYWWI